MLKVFNYVLVLCALAHSALSACLSSTFYSSLGLTAYSSAQTTNVTVCTNLYTNFGYCVNQDQVVKLISNKLYQQTRSILNRGDSFYQLLHQIDKRIDGLLKNLNKVAGNNTLKGASFNANGTIVLGSNSTARLLTANNPAGFSDRLLQATNSTNSSGNATNGTRVGLNATVKVNITLPPPPQKNNPDSSQTVKQKNSTSVEKKSPKNMQLNNATIQALQAFRANLTAKMGTVDAFTKKAVRNACYQALFKVYIGTTCLITSGAATSYTTFDGATLTSVQISQADAANVTTHCVPLIYPVCVARQAAVLLANLTGQTTGVMNNPKSQQVMSVCQLLDANPTCVQTPSSCTADIQTAILSKMVNSGDDPFVSDVDLQATSDSFVSADSSINSTLSAGGQANSRRLQNAAAASTSSSSYSYQTSSNAPSASNEADKSNVPSESVESGISSEIPASANSNASSGSAGRFTMVATLISIVFSLAY